MIGYFMPSSQVVGKSFVPVTVFQRMRIAAVHTGHMTQPDIHIFSGPYIFRRLDGIMIGQCSNHFIRKILFHILRHFIDEVEQGTGIRSLSFVHCPAMSAFTRPTAGIVLSHAVYVDFRFLFHPCMNFVLHDASDIGICQA